MALGRTYTVDSGAVAITSTNLTPVLASVPVATATFDIEAIRVSTQGAASNYPSNAIFNVALYRTTAASSGGAAVVARQHDVMQTIASQTTWLSGSTALTVTTTGNIIVWSQNLPFTAGANWAEWVTPGAEWRAGGATTAGFAVQITCSSAGTGTSFQCELVYVE